jgi:hypothetical protein
MKNRARLKQLCKNLVEIIFEDEGIDNDNKQEELVETLVEAISDALEDNDGEDEDLDDDSPGILP